MLAYVLHSRQYKESSALLELFSVAGRQRAVLRGARGRSGSLARAFVPLDVELRGRSELKTVSRVEALGIPHELSGERLFSGFYLNELLLRLLAVEDAQGPLFEHYAATLSALAEGRALQPLLRSFEWRLLTELGYGFSLEQDSSGRPIAAGGVYRFDPEQGFEPLEGFESGVFHGHQLQALAAADWQIDGVLAAAKRLMRLALAPHLGNRPLVSRELFTKAKGP